MVDGRKMANPSHSLKFTEQSVPLGNEIYRPIYLTALFYLGSVSGHSRSSGGGRENSVGTTITPRNRLEQMARCLSTADRSQGFGNPYSVDDKARAVLNRGGPLTNSAVAHRQGQIWLWIIAALAAAVDTLQLAGQDRTKPPSFAVYKGDKQLGSGDFEFG